MSRSQTDAALKKWLAMLLRYGTWTASTLIALGLTPALLGHISVDGAPMASPSPLINVGIALFILLPVVRVVVMAIVFAADGDYLFTAIATLVLVVIGLGLALGGA